ncbi:MAG: hypothetical protein AB1384_12460 [Actinomycetota bacterium]
MKELTHFTSLREAVKVEGDKPRYRVQVLEADKVGANRRVYPKGVMEQAHALYEGAKVYLDHPTKVEDVQRPERSVRDLVGYLENVQADMTAELVVVKHQDEICPLIEESISTGRDLVGLSHNILGLTRITRQADGPVQVVESIEKVKSVDVVTEQAAGGRFKELLEGKEEGLMIKTLEELKEAYPELLDEFKEGFREELRNEVEQKVYGDKEKVKEAKQKMEEKLNELKEAISSRDAKIDELTARLERRDREQVMEGKLSGCDLPEVTKERVRSILEGQYENMEKFVEAVDAAIKSEKEYLSKVTEAGKITGLGSPRKDEAPAIIKEAEDLLASWMGVKEDKEDK